MNINSDEHYITNVQKKFEINIIVYSMLQVKTCQLASTTQFANCIRYLNLLTTIENLHVIYFTINTSSFGMLL